MKTIKTLADNKLIRYFILFLVSIAGIASYMTAEELFAMETTIRDADGLYRITDGEYGALAGAYSLLVVYGGALILGGIFIDKCGIRLSGIVASVILIIGFGLVTYSMIDLRTMVMQGVDIPVINMLGRQIRLPILYGLLGFAIFGAGAETLGVVLTKVLNRWFLNKELEFALASQVAIARIGIGATYGITPYLASFYNGNVSAPLMIGVGILVLGLLLYLVYCIFDRKLDNQVQASGKVGNDIDESENFHWSDLGTIIRSKSFWAVCIICCLFYGSVKMFDKYSPGLVVDHFGIVETASGTFNMISAWTIVVFTPLLGVLVGKKGRSLDLLIGGSVLAMVCFLILDLFDLPKPLLYTVFVLDGISFSLIAASLWPLVRRTLPYSVLGTGYAVIFLFQNIMFLVVPRIISVVETENRHFVLAFASLAALSTVATVVFKIMDKNNSWKLNTAQITTYDT